LDDRAIGIFDSGLGGLTVVRELVKRLPNEDIVYFGDTGRIPYGTRSRETIIKYAEQDVKFLQQHNVKCVIAACGTVSTVLPTETYNKFGVLYTGVVEPAVQAALRITSGKIGIIATEAAVRSGTYEREIYKTNEKTKVFSKGCPLFVSLVENGFTARNNEIAVLTAREYLTPLKNQGIDTLIMGCTHFPILRDIIQDCIGDGVRLIDPGLETARHIEQILKKENLLKIAAEHETGGKHSFYVSDSAEQFLENARVFLGGDITGTYEQIVL